MTSGEGYAWSDETFIVTRELALAYQAAQAKPSAISEAIATDTGYTATTVVISVDPSDIIPTNKPPSTTDMVHAIAWSGSVSSQKWMNFYTRVLSKFVTGSELSISVTVKVKHNDGIPKQQVEETLVALRELGFNDRLE